MGVDISPWLPDGLPLVIGDRLGSLAEGMLLGWLVLRPSANGDVELSVTLGNVLPRVARRASTALFSTGALVDQLAVVITSLDVVVGSGPATFFLRSLSLPTPPGWNGVSFSSDEDVKNISIPL